SDHIRLCVFFSLPVMKRTFILATLALFSCAHFAAAATATTQPAPPPPGTLAERAQSLLGLVAFTFIAFLIGRARGARRVPWRVVGWGTVLEFVFGAIVLFAPN